MVMDHYLTITYLFGNERYNDRGYEDIWKPLTSLEFVGTIREYTSIEDMKIMAKGKTTYKYKIISEQEQPYGHMLYLIRYVSKNGAKSEQWIGQSKLKRFYEQDRLDGALSDHVRGVVTAELKKSKGMNRGKIKLTPRDENYTYSDNSKPNWQIQDEFVVDKVKAINIKAYCHMTPDNRWHVIMNDGVEDEDTYPTEKWAKEMVEMYNNPDPKDG